MLSFPFTPPPRYGIIQPAPTSYQQSLCEGENVIFVVENRWMVSQSGEERE
jgi:hypothetical protein